MLKRLVDIGDVKAKRAFTEEIAIQFSQNYETVCLCLINEGYLNYLSVEQLDVLIKDKNLKAIWKNSLKFLRWEIIVRERERTIAIEQLRLLGNKFLAIIELELDVPKIDPYVDNLDEEIYGFYRFDTTHNASHLPFLYYRATS